MSEQDPSYICNICSKCFAGPLTLKIHERVHTDRKTSPKTSSEPKENKLTQEKQFFGIETREKIVKKSSPKKSRKPHEDFCELNQEMQSLKCKKCAIFLNI
mgnify:CR=1 FL=1